MSLELTSPELAERLARLSPAQRALLEQEMARRGIAVPQPAESRPSAAEQRIPRRQPAPHYPLSIDQERIYFTHSLAPEKPYYNVYEVLRFIGRLDVATLSRSLRAVVRRHEILRTTFTVIDGEAVQIVHPPPPLRIAVVDLTRLAATPREREARRVYTAALKRPFDLERLTLFRTFLIRVEREEHICPIVFHHLIIDWISFHDFQGELVRHYAAFDAGVPPALPEPRIQYADFAVWQRQQPTEELWQRQLAYWREKLRDAPSLTELPGDRPPPPVRSGRGARQPLQMSKPVSDALRRLAQREGATLNMALLAGFKALISRLSGRSRVVVGIPIATHNQTDLQGVLGFFINQLVLYTDLGGDPDFTEVVRRVRRTSVEAFANKDVPFGRVVEALRPERNLSRVAVTQLVFLFLNPQELDNPQLPGLTFKPCPFDGESSEFDINFSLWDRSEGFDGWTQYNVDLFDRTTIQRANEHFKTLMTAAMAEPHRPLSQLDVLGPAGRQQLLVEWQEPLAEPTRPAVAPAVAAGRGVVHAAIAVHAATRPDAVAVVSDDVAAPAALSHGELDRRAIALARRLRAAGVGPDATVGLWLERSPEIVVAILATLKAGGAFLPLDLTYPAPRLRFILADAGVAAVVTQASLAGELPPHGGATLLVEERGDEGTDNVELPSVGPEALAYGIYTSGSTGEPKGVAVPHGATAAHVALLARYMGLGPGERVLQFTATSFDPFVEQIFLALASGASLVLRGDEMWPPEEFGERSRALRVTTSHLPTHYWQEWTREQLRLDAKQEATAAVPASAWRIVSAGGEAMRAALARRRLRGFPPPWNIYGPAEGVVAATVFPLAGGLAADAPRVPIGRPLPGHTVVLRDRRAHPVPITAPGEICLGGPCVARGYLGRPALTAERFVPDPGRELAGSRLYRTGDLARYLADGNVDFLGRRDHQVKLRGVRIELEEIERQLEATAGVREAVVVMRQEGGEGAARLAAYVVATEPIPARDAAGKARLATQIGRWRKALREQLPEHMMPASFLVLPELPKNASGKVDRNALPEPEGEGGEGRTAVPRSGAEEALGAIWAQLLKVEQVAPRDNFFELGGHSLLGIQLISRVREAFGVGLRLRDLFDVPTLAQMARLVMSRGSEHPAPPLVRQAPAADDGGERDAGPLSFAQERLWFLDRLVPDNPFYNMSSSFRLAGPLDVRALGGAVGALVERHEALRTSFRVVAGEARQIVAGAAPSRRAAAPAAVDLERLPAARREAELARLSLAEVRRPFDLTRGPLVRFTLVRLAPREHVLSCSLHHIVTDGWSQGIFYDELSALYEACHRGAPPALPPLPVQYPDFARWQRQWLRGEALAEQLRYWKERLAGLAPRLELPLDRPRPAVETFRGGFELFRLPPPRVEALRLVARERGATPSMVLLAAYKLLLARCSGRDDVAVGVAVANRTRREIEGLIGFFVNTLVLRTDLGGAASYEQLIKRVRETALGAYAHQELPFEKLVAETEKGRDLSRNPLVQVMFAYQNFPNRVRRLRDLTVSSLAAEALDTGTSKFDLTLFLTENDDGALQGVLEHNRDLFDVTTVRRLRHGFVRLLEAALGDPAQSPTATSLLDAAERHQALREWNDSPGEVAVGGNLAELFAAVVERRGDAAAVIYGGQGHGDRVVTYAELDRRAAGVARELRRLGVGRGGCVGICLERSPELVVAILGTVRAGAAYLPLDPAAPVERLAFQTKDAGAGALLTAGAGGAVAMAVAQRSSPALPVLRLERIGPSADGVNGAAAIDGADLACVIYTSGSTGKPKGAGITHRGVVRRFVGANFLAVADGDRIGQTSHVAFDALTFEVWSALLNGGALVGVERDDLLSAERLGARLRERRIAAMLLTTALFHQIADRDPAVLAPLATLLVGGEAADPARMRAVLAAAPPARLLNAYGPTEATTMVAWHRVRAPLAGPGVPIGRPFSHVSLHVLDPRLQPVPLGVAGELAIADRGPARGVSRGYLRRPSLTAASFVPDPFAGAGDRLYRTGDRVRRLNDGALDFVGRIDEQVKMRGFRIEPGEIEAVLDEHPAVRQSVVLARGDATDDKRLVAYVVADLERPAPAASAPAADERAGTAWQSERVAEWEMIFDDVYRRAPGDPADLAFNVIGWDSTFTGEPLPAAEMREWVDDTVERLLALSPRRVLEIGCGTGLLLLRIAPRVELYHGTDVSTAALRYLEGAVERLESPSQLRLEHRPADDFTGIEPAAYDLVILNSVVQYFPDAAYLRAVVAGAVASVRPGGAVFLGDLRSLPLLPAFHAAVELFQAPDELPLAELRERLRGRRMEESELAVDPAFFAALQHEIPAIRRVEVHPKGGRFANELNAFRYQVVLRVGADVTADAAAVAPRPLDWRGEGWDLERLRRWLADERPAAALLTGLPNARVATAVAAARRLAGGAGGGDESAARLRALTAGGEHGGVDPWRLRQLGAELGYAVELGWANPGSEGSFDAVLWRADSGTSLPDLAAQLPTPSVPGGRPRELGAWTNRPLAGRFARQLVPELRAWLGERLPAYMVPASFVPLDELPLTERGKVDRAALPAPESARPELTTELAPPRNPVEERLAAVWADVLGYASHRAAGQIGIDDSFFELGGHSLLATRVTSQIRDLFGVELPLRALFETPTIRGLAPRLAGAARPASAAPPLVRRGSEPEGALPLSFAQERLWFLDRLEPGNPAYNVWSAWRLNGALDVAALRGAVARVTARHEALRTTFVAVDGVPRQIIAATASPGWTEVDVAALPEARREPEVRRFLAAAATSPFDLARGPLLRLCLARLGGGRQALLICVHHIVADGWSLGIFFDELTALYDALRRGSAAGEVLPEPSIQYGDFALWQRRWLSGEERRRQLAYWQAQLADPPPALELPAAYRRGETWTARGGRVVRELDAASARRLRALARGEGASLYMTLLAAFNALLYRYTGQRDLLVGSPIAGRNRREVEGVIGFFLNTLVLRTDCGGDPTFRELLARVRETTLEAYAHQDLPFEAVLEEIHPERSLGRTPLFQVMFNMVNLEEPGTRDPGAREVALAGLEVAPFPLAEETARFDLTLYASEPAGGVRFDLVYHAELFAGSQIEGLLDHLQELLTAAVADPEVRLSALPLSLAAEPGAAPWTSVAGLPWPPAASVSERFVQVAGAYADRVAVAHGDGAWSYGELYAASSSAAARLHAVCGRGPGCVALLFTPGGAMAVGVLGCLAAGKWYLPLDPTWPRERLREMLADAGAEAIFGEPRLQGVAEELFAEAGVAPLPFVGCAERRRRAGTEPAPADGSPEALAYVLYTSGSLGRPKGVVQSQRRVAHHARVYGESLGIGPEDRLTLLSSYSFDAAVMDLFGALLHGATLCPWHVREVGVHGLAAWLAARRITVYHSTPTVFRAFAEAASAAAAPAIRSVRRAVLGGEEARREDVERCSRLFAPTTELINGLGPTESTLALQHAARGELTRASVPVGFPVAGSGVLLRNAAGEQVAPYGLGEIALRGPALAVGYWRRPAATAAAFVPDPAGDGGRLYRTGDLGRYLPDGALEFAGRRDRQLKVRGFRVEPAEIEAALARHPGVRAVAVVAAQGTGDEPVLTAWVTATLANEDLPAELRRHLAFHLPAFMQPAAIAVAEEFPLTATGKVDRAALERCPARQAEIPEKDGPPATAPRNAGEDVVAAVWAELLGRERVGIHDDFFALGGHSLLAIRVVSRLQQAFGVEVPLRAVFESPTVAGLAARVEAARQRRDGVSLPPLTRLPRREWPARFPLSFAQERLWFLDQLLPGSALYTLTSAVKLAGRLDVARLDWALGQVVDRHEALRTTFQVDAEGAPEQVVARRAAVALRLVDLTALDPPAREATLRRLTRATPRPFDLARGPLLRAVLIRVAAAEHALTLAIHHAIADAWSLATLTREISRSYRQAVAGAAAPSPAPLACQYGDFAAWQRSWLTGEVLAAQLEYWRGQLAGLAVLELPTDRPRPPLAGGRVAEVAVHLDAELGRELRRLSRGQGTTLFMTLLAAFHLLLGRLAGQDDVAVGTPIANRRHPDLEELIGLFVNMLVLRGDLRRAASFSDLLARTREAALGAYAHQDLTFEKLVEELRPPRDLSRHPLFQLSFQLLNTPPAQLELPGLTLRPHPPAGRWSELDLDLALLEVGEGVQGVLRYRVDLFDATTVRRLLARYVTLLRSAAAAPERSPAALSLTSLGERHQLLQEWSGEAEGDRAPLPTVVARILRQAALTPDAVAVTWRDEEWSYGEVVDRARSLARRLRARGDRPLAAVALERSPAMVVAFLGCWLARSAYLPIDPALPSERIAFMMRDAGVEAILTSEAVLAGPLAAWQGGDVPILTRILGSTGGVETGAPAAASDLAYLIYTSGSTGRPKGVEIPHRGVTSFLHAMERSFPVGADDAFLAVTTITFDIVVLDLFLPLMRGGRAVLAEEGITDDGAVLAALLLASRANHMQATPTTWRLLLESGWPGHRDLTVLCGGEAMSRDLARQLGGRVRALWNVYGPTETTVWSALTRVAPEEAGEPAIGRPIERLRMLLVDRTFRLAPAGSTGELVIGGAGTAFGYRGRPRLTAEHFSPDPFAAAPGERLYRSGDLARALADGRLAFLGRRDHQVKVRGFRIELGEIEAALRRHPQVRHAAVKPWDDRLAAYLVLKDDGAAAAAAPPAFRDFLRRWLPEYMVPAAYVVLEAFPRTPSGKLDRRALPAPSEVRPAGAGPAAGSVAPRTPVEERLAAIWSEVLALPEVGVEESFFDLGGHSLLATRVVTRVRGEFGVELAVRELFGNATVAALAAVIEARLAPAPPVEAPLRRVSRQARRVDRAALDDEPADG